MINNKSRRKPILVTASEILNKRMPYERKVCTKRIWNISYQPAYLVILPQFYKTNDNESVIPSKWITTNGYKIKLALGIVRGMSTK